MAYDVAKDKVLKEWTIGDGLSVSVASYDGKEPKVRIGPRVIDTGSGPQYRKAGSLSKAEYEALVGLGPKIGKLMVMPKSKAK